MWLLLASVLYPQNLLSQTGLSLFAGGCRKVFRVHAETGNGCRKWLSAETNRVDVELELLVIPAIRVPSQMLHQAHRNEANQKMLALIRLVPIGGIK